MLESKLRPGIRVDRPPNDPNHPRWLLDMKNWEICAYRDIAEVVAEIGYGIVSYTWGRFAVSGQYTEVGRPTGVFWEIPVMKPDSFTLDEARELVEVMGKRYLWWDWMCVPQGNDLTAELQAVQGQEVAKQLAIYSENSSSVVWVHRTIWGKNSALESWLSTNWPAADQIPKFLQVVEERLKETLDGEPWLTSGWTLQEGAILSRTPLLDRYGKPLPGNHFMHGGKACVIDLTAVVTGLATRITDAFMSISKGDTTGGPVVDYIVQSDDNYQYVSRVVSKLLTSGLVAYAEKEPLYLLAGKKSRNFSRQEDQCWALLGALGMTGVQVTYDLEMLLIKERFFRAMLEMYQWELFFVPSPPSFASRLTWAELFVNGSFVPLGLYFKIYLEKLPKISWMPPTPSTPRGTIVLSNDGGATFPIFTPHALQYIRRYVQLQDSAEDFGYVRVTKIQAANVPSATGYLHMAELESYSTSKGKRCMEITNLQGNTVDGFSGNFNGVVDVWFDGGEIAEACRELHLDIQQT